MRRRMATAPVNTEQKGQPRRSHAVRVGAGRDDADCAVALSFTTDETVGIVAKSVIHHSVAFVLSIDLPLVTQLALKVAGDFA